MLFGITHGIQDFLWHVPWISVDWDLMRITCASRPLHANTLQTTARHAETTCKMTS